MLQTRLEDIRVAWRPDQALKLLIEGQLMGHWLTACAHAADPLALTGDPRPAAMALQGNLQLGIPLGGGHEPDGAAVTGSPGQSVEHSVAACAAAETEVISATGMGRV